MTPRGGTITAGAVVTAALLLGACASRSEVADLRKEVEALKTTQAQMIKQIGGARTQQAQQKALPDIIEMGGIPIRGTSPSNVMLVEFSDYECPFCIRHFSQVMPQIEQAYIATGKIQYAFRDFPIDELHPQSIRAHIAAHCAIQQNKFWDLHPKLFSKPGTHTPEQLDEQARSAGLDVGAFDACIANEKFSTSIRESTRFAISLGATGTPFFVVGTYDPATRRLAPIKAIPGAYPFATFQQTIDDAIAKR